MTADSDTSSLYSLSPSLYESLFRFQGSRKVQAVNEDYSWPCDSTATIQERLTADILAQTYRNGLYPEPREGKLEEVLSSESQPGRILDLGCGTTASWAISMAERFPLSEVIGVDLIPTDLDFLPPNLSIEVHDLLEGLPYPSEHFTLIHCRFASASFLSNSFLTDVARALKPGGVLVLQELENMASPFLSLHHPSPRLDLLTHRHSTRVAQLLARHGPRYRAGPLEWSELETMGRRVRDTGEFEEKRGVLEMCIEHPIGGDPRSAVPWEQQPGTMVRRWWACTWEMMGVSAGLSEIELARERELDELVLPETDIGLYCRCSVVWAEKRVC